MDRQTLRDWCIATTRMAWPGWRTGPGLGVSLVWPKPSGSEVAKWVEDGPDLKTDGVVRWRCADCVTALPQIQCSSA